jgi:methylglutaconyl-CoA hydratase
MNSSSLILKIENQVAYVELNRPEKRNALNDVLVKEITDTFISISKNSSARAAILSGSGKAFCSGADLEYLKKISKYSLEENQEDSKNLMRMYQAIYECRKPVIALVDGPALAGGCGLATVCDFIIASNETGQFGYPEVKIGFIPAIVLVFLVKRIGEGRARELVLTGKVIGSQEAKNLGLINDVIDSRNLKKHAENFCRQLIDNNSGTAISLCKELFSAFNNMDTKQALEYASNLNALSRMTEDCKRGVNSFLLKEKIKW